MAGSTDDHVPHRPGSVSVFFIYKAGLFAVAGWTWLAVLAVQHPVLSGWHLVAASGAVTMTLVAVTLGVRYTMARAAADRHRQVMASLVEMSWYAFTAPAAEPSDRPRVTPTGSARGQGGDPGGGPTDAGDASVISLGPDWRLRARR